MTDKMFEFTTICLDDICKLFLFDIKIHSQIEHNRHLK